MRKPAKVVTAAGLVAALIGTLALSAPVAAAEAQSVVEQGKELAFDRKKGNCLACHHIEGGDLPGNIGPALIKMKIRFRDDKAALREQVYDATLRNPDTIMPPFGLHGILTDQEIDKVVEFLYTL